MKHASQLFLLFQRQLSLNITCSYFSIYVIYQIERKSNSIHHNKNKSLSKTDKHPKNFTVSKN